MPQPRGRPKGYRAPKPVDTKPYYKRLPRLLTEALQRHPDAAHKALIELANKLIAEEGVTHFDFSRTT